MISNSGHYLKEFTREEAVPAHPRVERVSRLAARQAQGQDRRDRGRDPGRRRRSSARARTRGEAGRPARRPDQLEPPPRLSGRRRRQAVLPALLRSRHPGVHASAVGRLRRGAHEGVPARVERRPSVRLLPRAGAADREGPVRGIPDAQVRRQPSRRRHLRDHRPDGLRLRAARQPADPRPLRPARAHHAASRANICA